MKIQPGQCKRCKAVIYLSREAGITWTADMEPLDALTMVGPLVEGREIYLLSLDGRQLGPAPATILKELLRGGRTIVASHPCPTAVAGALLSLAEKGVRQGDQGRPKGRETGTQAPSRRSLAPTRSSSTAPTAGHLGSRPICNGCSQPCDDGTYASIELGNLTVWAEHVDTCP